MYWAFFPLVLILALYEFSAILWMFAITSWPSAYLGVVKPGPLPPHLPVARHRLLICALLPLFASALLGSGIEYVFGRAENVLKGLTYRADRSATVSGARTELTGRVSVPIFAWRTSWGPPPSVITPQGTSRPLEGHVVVPGLSLQIYNPYAARLDEERGFVNHQVSRALTEFLHKEVSPDDVERACAPFRGNSESFSAKCLRVALAAPYRPPFAFTLVRLVILLAAGWWFLRLHLRTLKGKRGEALLWVELLASSLAIFGVAHVFDSMKDRDPTGLMSPFFSLGVLVAELVRVAERVPVISVAVVLAALWAMFWDLARRYRRVELLSGRW